MPGWVMVVVDLDVVIVVEMIVRLSGRIIVGGVVGRSGTKSVVVPRLVRSGWHVDAMSCLQPGGKRPGCAVSAFWRRRRYQV